VSGRSLRSFWLVNIASRRFTLTTAQSIFVIYGVVALGYGFVLGVPLAAARMKAPQAPRHLVTTHLSAIIQGAVHLGLGFLVAMVTLGNGWATAAVVLIVVASALELAGGTINWPSGTGDQFSERSLGFHFNSLVGPPAIIRIGIMLVGALRTL
jgi:hypothetical protein